MNESRDGPEEHRLARAVDAAESVDSATRQRERHVVEHDASVNHLGRMGYHNLIRHESLPSEDVAGAHEAKRHHRRKRDARAEVRKRRDDRKARDAQREGRGP